MEQKVLYTYITRGKRSAYRYFFCVTGGEKCLQVHIGCGELQHILCHLGPVTPCLFLDISPSCAQRLGQALVEQQPTRSRFMCGTVHNLYIELHSLIFCKRGTLKVQEINFAMKYL